ncbi:RHS repeat-associated core domain-containing protein [Xanthomonas arboricola]|uniref:RHS repeat-associated core domain-containing protein n=1 Tax=Xanthomonas arboricola TaxID=56448 RepID=UPI00126949D6|nr:RHS repeat-associated core domain-containing protein [Xanthomonas arboricola]
MNEMKEKPGLIRPIIFSGRTWIQKSLFSTLILSLIFSYFDAQAEGYKWRPNEHRISETFPSPHLACEGYAKWLSGINEGRAYNSISVSMMPDTPWIFECSFYLEPPKNYPIPVGPNFIEALAVREGNNCGTGHTYNPATGACNAPDDLQPAMEMGGSLNPSCSGPGKLQGNPINVTTGNKFQREIDYISANNQLGTEGLELIRYYNSTDGLWRHNFSTRLLISEESVALIRADGRQSVLQMSPSAAISSQQDGTLEQDGVNWRYRDKSNNLMTFNGSGKLLSLDTSAGSHFKLTYSSPNVVTIELAGRYATITEDNKHQPISARIGGLEITYSYDTYGMLVNVDKKRGSIRLSRKYHYELARAPNLLTGITDESGVRYVSWSYDDFNRALYSSGPAEIGKTTISYLATGNAEVVSPLGARVNHHYNVIQGVNRVTSVEGTSSADCTSDNSNYEYDELGQLTSKVNSSGRIVKYEYNARGLITTQQEHAKDKALRTIRNEWLKEKPLLSKMTEGTRSTDYQYDDQSRLVTVTNKDLSAHDNDRTTKRKYCLESDVISGICPIAGLLVSLDGTREDTPDLTSYQYYSTNAANCSDETEKCPYRIGDLWKIVNSAGHVTEYLSYDESGRALSVKRANGVVTDYEYHALGWLTSTKVRGSDASSEADDRITRIDYWPTGLVKQVTQPDGAFTAFTYDAAHRLTDITDNAGNTVHYTLDNAGNRVKEDTQDAAGTLKRTLSRVYNQLGQLKTQATAASDPTDFEYDANGNATKVTDALATATQSEYDPLNRLSRTLQDVAGIKADTTFDYDALDNLTKVTDPKGLDTKYEYNGFGDLVKLTSLDTGVTSYTYDSAGNRATQTDARGNTTAYGYDALNRLTKVTYPTTSLNVAYTYDVTQTACASGETFSIGRLTKMQDGGAITQYCYNRFGDLVRKVQTSNGKALVLRYDYTVGGQLRRMTYPDGAVVDYVRNAQGQTTEVGVTPAGGSRQVLLGNASYYPFGPAAGWTYGNGRTLSRQYDLDYRPQAIHDTRPGGLEVGFGFDPAGNLTALTPAGNPTPEIGLGYDTLGRLTGLKDGRTGTLIDGYSYDATGNRLSAKVGTATQAYTYPTDSHRLSAVAGVARSYDATGNTTAIGGTARQYTYDTTGRMTQARRAGAVTMNYRYNGKGEQVRRFLGTTNTYTLYDEAGHWLGDYDTNGAPKQQAIWLDDLPVGLLANANKLHYIEPDHLGSPRVVIDPTRDVAVWTWSLKGEAFGNTAPNQDPDGDGAALVLDMRFPGQRFDAASGLNQNYFRDYDPATGRYGQSDPIGLRGGSSTFGYALQAPFVHMDFYGLATWKGSTFGVGVGAGKFGLNIDFYQVTSPCPGGGLASAYVMAVGGAGGLGAPISMAGSQVELMDSNDVPDPDVFNGPYAKFSAGSVSFGLGYQMYQKISIGGAWWNFGAGAESTGWHQRQGGFDATIYGAAAGNAVVIQQKKCSCEAQ